MRNITKTLIAVAAPITLVGTLVATAPTASAATDHRACVTRTEYRSVHAGMSASKVKSIFDTNGTGLTSQSTGYYEGAWVEDGYWDSYYDEYTGQWYDEWVDTSYWDDYAGDWISVKDSVRAYKKCSSWGGGGRVGINFDNYSSASSGMRVYGKVPNSAQALADYIDYLYEVYGVSAHSGRAPEALASPNGGDDKKLPQAPDGRHPVRPESRPTTPDPHPNGPDGEIPAGK